MNGLGLRAMNDDHIQPPMAGVKWLYYDMIDQILAEEKQNFDANQPVVLRIPPMQAPGYRYAKAHS